MEGVAAEAGSLAGHLELGKLMGCTTTTASRWRANRVWFTEDVAARFRAYGWQVLKVDQGDTTSTPSIAPSPRRAQDRQPTLMIVRTTIGFGAPNKQGTFGVHGAPLGAAEAELAKNATWAGPRSRRS